MTMHLVHPSLSLQGKRKGKLKFRNAAEAQKARELSNSWDTLLKSHGTTQETKKRNSVSSTYEPLSKHYSLSTPKERTNSHIKSLGSDNGVATLKQSPTYTGSECIGVTVLHKSCLQPVFSKQEAVDAAKMRR
jgi:hypothetical protein